MRVAVTIGLLLVMLALPHNAGAALTRTGKPVRVRANPVTSYPNMVAELHADARRSPWIRLAAIGKSHKGRILWLVRVANPNGPSSIHTTRLLVLCRQHGDEPASTEAMLGLLRRTAAGTYHLPPGVTLYVVPMVNPDGAAADTRLNGVGADLNRDWGVFSQPETRAVAHAAALLRPQILVDAHNWDTTDSYNANCLEVSRDNTIPLERAEQGMEAQEIAALGRAGFSVAATSYDQYADPHLAHRWFTSQGVLACLVETHSGSPQDTADFQRRQEIYVTLIETLARRYADAAPALDALEHLRPSSVREAALFPPSPLLPPIPKVGREAGGKGRTLWPWAVLPYALALFAALFSRQRGSGTTGTPAFSPASGRRSEGRPDTRRYPRSRYSLAPRPAPVASGRRR